MTLEKGIWAAHFLLETSWSLLTCLIPLHLQSFIPSVFTADVLSPELGTIATHSLSSDTLTPLVVHPACSAFCHPFPGECQDFLHARSWLWVLGVLLWVFSLLKHHSAISTLLSVHSARLLPPTEYWQQTQHHLCCFPSPKPISRISLPTP